MNVLFLTRRFYPEIGGVEKHVFEVSKELIKRGYKVTVIAENPTAFALRSVNPLRQSVGGTSNYHSRDQSDTYGINSKKAAKSIQTDDSEPSQLKVLRLDFGKEGFYKKFNIWLQLSKRIKIIKGADVVHCHDVFFWYLPFRFLFSGKKVFTTFHGYETKFPPTIKAKLVRKISEKLSYGNICVGDFIKKWYGTKPDYVTYGGVSEIQNSKFKIQNVDKKGKKINILIIGRLDKDNGAKIYLEALRKLNKQISYKLTVCGDGEFRNQFKKYGRVHGYVRNANKYIDRADFIFASSYLSILEALARGKKVISISQNDLKEDYLSLSPFSKFIYIFNDSYSLVNRLIAISDATIKSHNIQREAYKWAKNQTWGKVVDVYLKLWNL